jgi:CheY-like chemotaxis protein
MLAFPPEPVRSRRRKKVLLIDDGPGDTEIAVKALKRAEIPVRTASDARSALAAVTEERPDVIVLEPRLGGGTGAKEFVRALKANVEWAGIPVVLHAAGSTASLDQARSDLGADEIVLKGQRGDEALVSQVITLFRRK